jgi:peptidoglycan/xylan/chitin deacetylase (PgdA/CDA1 family)
MVGDPELSAWWLVRRAAKTAAAGALLAAGAHRAVRTLRTLRAGGARVLLLSYHRVTLDFGESARDAIPSMLVSAGTLRRQLTQLGRTWEIVSLSDAARILAEGDRGPRRGAFAAITFDDGYADNHAVALPVLAALRMPATVYLATGLVDGAGRFAHDRLFASLRELARRGVPYERAGLEAPLQATLTACAERSPAATLDRIIAALPHRVLLALAEALEARTGLDAEALGPGARPLAWEEVRELAAAGIDIGGHSVNHAVLPNLTAEEVRREVLGCRDAIAERLGHPPRHFAYPNGLHSPAVRRAVREAGFDTGSTTEDAENVRGQDPFALRRKVFWEGSTLGPLGYSQALATCGFEGVFGALRLSRAVPGERPDLAVGERRAGPADADRRAAS